MKQTTFALAGVFIAALCIAGFATAEEVVIESAQDATEVEVLEVVEISDGSTMDDPAVVALEVEESDELVVAMTEDTPHEVWWGNRSHSFGNYLRFDRGLKAAGPCKYCDSNLIDCESGYQCESCEYICESCDDCPPTYFDKIFFDLNKAVLRPEGIAECEKAIAYLGMHPEKRILIEGHTCDLASDPYNSDLGRRRAEAVRSYLVNQGVDPSRISTESFGESTPWVNSSQRELNRRAIIIVL